MKHKASGWLVAGLLLLAAAQAWAGGVGAVRKTVVSTLLLSGQIRIDAQGHVTGYTLDREAEVNPAAQALMRQAVPAWTFVPVMVDGKAVPVESSMRVRLAASRQQDGTYSVSVASASFGGNAAGDAAGADGLRQDRMEPPVYPAAAAKEGIQGTVFMLLRVGRDGRVKDAAVERTNLATLGTERQLPGMRRMLEGPSLTAARAWTFSVPVSGPLADQEYFQVRVPIDYRFSGEEYEPKYGQWRSYVPGPINQVPWRDQRLGLDAIDAAQGGGDTQVAGLGLKLLTPLGNS